MGDPILLFGAGENRFVFGHGERLCLSARNIHCQALHCQAFTKSWVMSAALRLRAVAAFWPDHRGVKSLKPSAPTSGR
jgi:hypothetical protein